MKKRILALSFCLLSSFSINHANASESNSWSECKKTALMVGLLTYQDKVNGMSLDESRSALSDKANNPKQALIMSEMFDIVGVAVYKSKTQGKSAVRNMERALDKSGYCKKK